VYLVGSIVAVADADAALVVDYDADVLADVLDWWSSSNRMSMELFLCHDTYFS
jgi:hypothetical protein